MHIRCPRIQSPANIINAIIVLVQVWIVCLKKSHLQVKSIFRAPSQSNTPKPLPVFFLWLHLFLKKRVISSKKTKDKKQKNKRGENGVKMHRGYFQQSFSFLSSNFPYINYSLLRSFFFFFRRWPKAWRFFNLFFLIIIFCYATFIKYPTYLVFSAKTQL